MRMILKLSRVLKLLTRHGSVRVRFSQYGEDTIIRKYFKKSDGFYIDVGAHHPFKQSNTAYLWLQGWEGVNVDANSLSVEVFKKVRPSDINVWSAIVSEQFSENNSVVDFYKSKSIDLCASVSAELAADRGATSVEAVPCTSLDKIIETYAPSDGRKIDFLNIDLEGLDEVAIEGISKWASSPTMIGIETYVDTIPDVLGTRTFKLLTEAGYEYRYQIGLTSIYILA